MRYNPSLALFLATIAPSLVSNTLAATHTWDGSDNVEWFNGGGTNWSPVWNNDGNQDAVVNSGDTWINGNVYALSLTIGDGTGSNASVRPAYDNALWGVTSITINADGSLAGSGNSSSHLKTINLNGGTIGGSDNGSSAAQYGVFNFDETVTVNGGANTSTISTTGGGVTLGQPGGTVFNVADGAASVDLLVSGNIVKAPSASDTGLIKSGAGTMVLSGTNTYQSGTTVNAGTLSIQGGSAMSSDGSVTINGGVLEVVQTLGGGGGDYNWYWGVDSTEIKTGGKLTINSHSHIRNLTLSGGELASTGVDPFYGYGSWVLDDPTTVNGGVTSIISAHEVNAQNGVFDVSAGSILNVTGTINNGSVTKSGAGTMVLSNTNTYTGATSVSNGTLKVSGSIATSDVTVNGGILASGSTGTVGKIVTVNSGASFAAGDVGTVGTATVADDLNFSSGSIFDWDLTTATNTYDKVTVMDQLNITSGAKFNLVSSTAFTDTFWDATHTWSDIFGSKAIDNFLVSNFLYSGSATAPSAEGYFTISGSSLTWNAVPEPTSALVGLLITAGLLRRRRA
jgi:autotransporter-associated beta strand protein